MKTKIYITILFIVLLSFGSCRHRYPVELVEADNLVYTHPELALEKLDSISKGLDSSHIDANMYCLLLRMQAKDKLYLPFGSLDSIQSLVKFYENGGDRHLLPRACYLMGRKMYEMHEVYQAFSFYHKVLDLLDEQDDVWLRGFVYSQVGYLMRDQNDLEQALSFYEKAYECHRSINNDNAIVLDLRDKAMMLLTKRKPRKALLCLNEALRKAYKIDDKSLVSEVQLQLANYYLYNSNQLDSVWSNLQPSLQSNRDGKNVLANFIASEYYWAIEKDDSTKFYLSQILKYGNAYDKQEASRRLLVIEMENDSDQAMELLMNQYFEFGDSVKINKMTENKRNGIALFNYASHRDQIEKLKSQNQYEAIYILALSLFLLSMFFAFFIYHQMSLVRKLKLKNKINELKLLILSTKNTNKDSLSAIKEKMNLQEFVEKEKHLSLEDWAKLDIEVNQLCVNFKKNLFALLALSENEYHICLLIKIGLGTKDIALLTSRTKQAVSMAKFRLYKKITGEKGKAEDLDRLLKEL